MADDIPWVVRLWDGARLCGEVPVFDRILGCCLIIHTKELEPGDVVTQAQVYRYTRVDEHTRTIDAFLEPCR